MFLISVTLGKFIATLSKSKILIVQTTYLETVIVLTTQSLTFFKNVITP